MTSKVQIQKGPEKNAASMIEAIKTSDLDSMKQKLDHLLLEMDDCNGIEALFQSFLIHRSNKLPDEEFSDDKIDVGYQEFLENLDRIFKQLI